MPRFDFNYNYLSDLIYHLKKGPIILLQNDLTKLTHSDSPNSYSKSWVEFNNQTVLHQILANSCARLERKIQTGTVLFSLPKDKTDLRVKLELRPY